MVRNDIACNLEFLFCTHTFNFNCFFEDFNCVFTQICCLSRVLLYLSEIELKRRWSDCMDVQAGPASLLFVYNKVRFLVLVPKYIHIIIIVTWSGVLYHVEWMMLYHLITWDAKSQGNPMVWPHPQDVILQARSSCHYICMFIIYVFLTLFWL